MALRLSPAVYASAAGRSALRLGHAAHANSAVPTAAIEVEIASRPVRVPSMSQHLGLTALRRNLQCQTSRTRSALRSSESPSNSRSFTTLHSLSVNHCLHQGGLSSHRLARLAAL